ncbi:hypothetical protein BDL97_03G036300 [Sphagnum fallax]|nr:hypothetical protein BDL97_03G036300 [Sphagnum fallax]
MLEYPNMTSSYVAAVASEAIENYLPKGSSISLDLPEEPQVQTRIRNNQTTGPIQSSSLSKPDVVETRSLLHSAGKIPSSADDERQLLRDRLLKQLEAKDNSHHYTPRADRNQRRMAFPNIARTSFSNQHLFNWRQGGSGSSPDFPHEEHLFVADRLNDLAPGHKTTSYELSLQTISEPQHSSTTSSQDADSKRAREFKLPIELTTFDDPSRQRLSSPETETMLNRIKGLIRIEKPTGSMIPGIERPIDELHVSDGLKIPRQSIKHPEPVALSFEDQLQSMSTHSWLPNLSMEVGSVSSSHEIGTSETISQLTDLLDAPVVKKPRKSLHVAKYNLFAMDGSDSEAMAPNSSCKEVSNMKGDDHIQVQNKKPKTLDFFKEGWAMDAIDMRAATTDKQQATCNEGQLENNLVDLKAKDNWSQYPDAAADCQVEVQDLEVQMPNCFKDLQMEGNSTTTFANVKHPVSTLQKVEQAECEQPTSAKSDHYQTICSGNASATEGSWQRLPDCITTPEMLLENTHFDPFDVNGAHTMGNSMPHLEVRMMEHEQVLVKLRAKDRIGLLMDLIQALWSLNLHVQHANIRTSTGNGNNVFAAKMAMSTTGKQTTQEIANAISKVLDERCQNYGSTKSPKNFSSNFPGPNYASKRLHKRLHDEVATS